MKIERFEDIIAWQKAKDLAIEIYRNFSKSVDFGFRDQICRSVISISSNIAEGFDRDTDREFRRFLFIAKGSCSEVKSMLYLAKDLNYLDKAAIIKLTQQCDEISRIISGLIKSLKT